MGGGEVWQISLVDQVMTELPPPAAPQEEGASSWTSLCWGLSGRMAGYPYLTSAHLRGFDRYKVKAFCAVGGIVT